MRLLERVRHVLGQTPPSRSTAWPAGMIALAIPVALCLALVTCGASLADDEGEVRRPAKRGESADKAQKENVTLELVLRTERDDDSAGPAKVKPRVTVERVEVEKPRKSSEAAPQRITEERNRKVIRTGDNDLVEIVAKEGTDREGRQIAELASMVKRLSAQVERLTKEVEELRRGESPSDQPKKAIAAPAIAGKPVKSATGALPARAAVEREVQVQVELAEAVKRATEEKVEAVRRRAREQEEQALEQRRKAEERARDEQRRAERERDRANEQRQAAEELRERAKRASIDALQQSGKLEPGELKTLIQKIEILLREGDGDKLKEKLKERTIEAEKEATRKP